MQRTSGEYKDTLAGIYSEERLDVAIAEFLTPSDFASLNCVSRYYREQNKKDGLWKTIYLANHPRYLASLFVGCEDFKPQFLAAKLFDRASRFNRNDLVHYYLKQFYQFMTQAGFVEKPWAQFYMGKLLCTGESPVLDEVKGVHRLFNAVKEFNDYRAAMELVAVFHEEEKSTWNTKIPKGASLSYLAPCLLAASKAQVTEVADALGCVYGKGIGVEVDQEQALLWFKQALEHHPNLEAEFHLGCLIIDEDAEDEAQFNAGIARLKAIFEKYPTRMLAYHIGRALKDFQNSLLPEMQNYGPSIEWLQRASKLKSGDAALELAEIYLSGVGIPQPRRIQLNLEAAVELKAPNSEFRLAEFLNEDFLENGDEAIELLKQGFHRGETACGLALVNIFLNGDGEEEKEILEDAKSCPEMWYENMERVWWVQAALLCGEPEARTHLESAVNAGCVFAQCALIAWTAIGSPGPAQLTADLVKAKEMLKKIDVVIWQDYLLVGEREGLCVGYVKEILESLSDKPSCQLVKGLG
jgi:TPR repeat protein